MLRASVEKTKQRRARIAKNEERRDVMADQAL